MRWITLMLVIAGSLWPTTGARSGEIEVIPLAEVRPGQIGHGLTVTSGTEPGRFDVEILGVVRNTAPGSSFILARLGGAGLEKSGVVAGMSGSPVYLDGRLAGAVAFSWTFSEEPLAGIRPAEEMLAIREFPAQGGSGQPTAVTLAELAAAKVPGDYLESGLLRLAPSVPAGGVAPVLWSGSGFGPFSEAVLRRALGPVGMAGEGSQGAQSLSPGEAVSVVLMAGDLHIAATGTVTERSGETILAFGHPFLGLGPVDLPLAAAEVITVVPNLVQSFKVANLGPVVGSWEQDRVAGMAGRLGGKAPTIPVGITIRSDRERRFELKLADLPALAPYLLGAGLLGTLESVGRTYGELSLDLVVDFRMGDSGHLLIQQSFEGASAALEAGSYLSAFAAYLMENPLAPVDLQEIQVELLQRQYPIGAFVLAAHLSNGSVRPGEEVILNVSLKPYRGPREQMEVPIRIPQDLSSGNYILLVGDGVSADVARIGLQPAAPQRLEQALAYLRSLHSRRELVVLGIERTPGLKVAGESLPQLPGTALSIWEASGARDASPLALAVRVLKEERNDRPLSGLVRLDLRVRRPDVWSEDEDVTRKGSQ